MLKPTYSHYFVPLMFYHLRALSYHSGIIASFNKRYITLAPVAGVIGLAFSLKDPNGLLKGVGAEGISIALLVRYSRIGITASESLNTAYHDVVLFSDV